MFAELLVLR